LAVFGFSYACRVAGFLKIANRFLTVLWDASDHSSVIFRCGLLGRANDPYLDGSGRTFQRCTWHLGVGTRTWGETYGFKVRRVYVSMQVKHINPRLTAREAREDE
jgi:hypothetical protein